MTTSVIDQIIAALEAGIPRVADRLCRDGLKRAPNDAGLLVLFALSLWHQADRAGALEVYARLTRAHSKDSLHWRNYAAALRMVGDLEAAERAYETAAGLAPDDAELLHLYGLMQKDLGKQFEARDTLLRAFGKAPESSAIRIHAALVCAACRDLRAEPLLRPWRKWLPLDDILLSELAEALEQIGDVEAAAELLEGMSRRLPDDRAIWLRLAGMYERMNRLGDAHALLDRIESAHSFDGEDTQARVEVAHQRAQLAARRHDHASERELLEHCGPRGEHDFAHWFALAHAEDSVGNVAAAMIALDRAHSLRIDSIKTLHPSWFEPGFRSPLIPAALLSKVDYARWRSLKAPDALQSPVFVVGYPRSGTTLMELMLDAHPRLQSMDERPFFTMLVSQLENSTGLKIPHDLERLGQRDCDELRKGYLTLACSKVPRRWDARLVDKNPLNMLHLPIIHRLFPAAKFIFAIRHPCDVLLSCYMQNFKATALSAACANLETLALNYIEAMNVWLHDADLFAPKVFISKYEDLVADPAEQVRRIADHLELEDAEALLGFDRRAREKRFIATPSYSQVIEPINAKGVGRWHRYGDYFGPALTILRPMLEHWGYADT